MNSDDTCGGGACTVGLPINQAINEGAIAPFVAGWIDPDNGIMPPPPALPGIGAWLMESGGGCRQLLYEQPSAGFFENLPGNGNLPDLVDGIAGDYLKSVLRDFGRASAFIL